VTLSIGIDELFSWIARLYGICRYTVGELELIALLINISVLTLSYIKKRVYVYKGSEWVPLSGIKG
jgi:hypothetical protein